MAKKKFQRVRKEDAEKILENLIEKDVINYPPPRAYIEDNANALQEYVRKDVVEKLISKITR